MSNKHSSQSTFCFLFTWCNNLVGILPNNAYYCLSLTFLSFPRQWFVSSQVIHVDCQRNLNEPGSEIAYNTFYMPLQNRHKALWNTLINFLFHPYLVWKGNSVFLIWAHILHLQMKSLKVSDLDLINYSLSKLWWSGLHNFILIITARKLFPSPLTTCA